MPGPRGGRCNVSTLRSTAFTRDSHACRNVAKAPSPWGRSGRCPASRALQSMKNTEPLTLEDCIFGALTNHFLTTLYSEARYVESLRNKAPNEKVLREMLLEFRVWRTLGETGKSRILPELLDVSRELQHNLSGSLAAKDSWAVAFERTSLWGQPMNGSNRYKSFASGLTKALWFSGGHRSPLFDIFTCRALRIAQHDRASQAKAFYQIHEDHEFEELRKQLQLHLDSSCKGWEPIAERLIDKALLIRGVEATKYSATRFHNRSTLKGYRDTFGAGLGFSTLARELVQLIRKSKYAPILENEDKS